MGKKIICLALLILNVSLSGCKMMKGDKTHPSKVQDQLINMDAYACLAQISHSDEGKTSSYETKQVYQMDGLYRFEVTKPDHIKGLTTINNGEKIIQYNPQVEEPRVIELPVNNFRNQIFLGTFVENYLQSKEVAIEVQKTEGALATVLEAVIPGGSKYMTRQKLWIDQKTHHPVKMLIYDIEDQVRITVEFLEFEYNPTIKENVFMID